MFSFDVPQAFAKGMTFRERIEVSGQEIGQVELDVPKTDVECPKQLLDFKDSNPNSETVTMLKPKYGPKDAPRAWRKKLHEVLIQWMSCRQLYAEPNLYCVHRRDEIQDEDVYKRAMLRNDEQQGTGKGRDIPPQECTRQFAMSIERARR